MSGIALVTANENDGKRIVLTTLLTIALLHWLALLTPGPNVMLVSQLAASGHRNRALVAGVGISVVAVGWALLAILGVHALFAAHAQLRLAMQILGGIYLCHIALKLWRSGAHQGEPHPIAMTPWAAFRLGFLTNITNPKTALFFGSVFAAVLPAQPGEPFLLAALILVFVNALVCNVMLSIVFSHPRIQAGYDKRRVLFTRVAAGILGGYGLRLLAVTADEVRGR